MKRWFFLLIWGGGALVLGWGAPEGGSEGGSLPVGGDFFCEIDSEGDYIWQQRCQSDSLMFGFSGEGSRLPGEWKSFAASGPQGGVGAARREGGLKFLFQPLAYLPWSDVWDQKPLIRPDYSREAGSPRYAWLTPWDISHDSEEAPLLLWGEFQGAWGMSAKLPLGDSSWFFRTAMEGEGIDLTFLGGERSSLWGTESDAEQASWWRSPQEAAEGGRNRCGGLWRAGLWGGWQGGGGRELAAGGALSGGGYRCPGGTGFLRGGWSADRQGWGWQVALGGAVRSLRYAGPSSGPPLRSWQAGGEVLVRRGLKPLLSSGLLKMRIRGNLRDKEGAYGVMAGFFRGDSRLTLTIEGDEGAAQGVPPSWEAAAKLPSWLSLTLEGSVVYQPEYGISAQGVLGRKGARVEWNLEGAWGYDKAPRLQGLKAGGVINLPHDWRSGFSWELDQEALIMPGNLGETLGRGQGTLFVEYHWSTAEES